MAKGIADKMLWEIGFFVNLEQYYFDLICHTF